MNLIAKIKSRRAFLRQLEALTDTGLIERIDAEPVYTNMAAPEIIQDIIARSGVAVTPIEGYSFQPGFDAKGDLEEVSLVKN